MLRFLVDMRGADATSKQLRDDLMTMLIAGHETTAAVLTWAFFCIVQVGAWWCSLGHSSATCRWARDACGAQTE